MRKNAREAVYKLIFSNIFNDKFDVDFKKQIFIEEKLEKSDIEFAENLLSLLDENESSINEEIESLSTAYKLDRIFPTDLCALKIAICEMKYIESIPYIVSISEAMELIRKYSTEDSPNFVNGILAQMKIKLENLDGNS